ncbi:MAG: transporter, partial [Bacilli bacterium]|nr:transporter [Bacilli bacterium]
MSETDSWKRVLWILQIGNFVMSAGISMVIPFLSLYVIQLGVKDQKSAVLWAGLIFGANHLFISIFSPLWGRFSDRFGQKRAMIYSGIGSGIVIGSMAFAGSPIHLLLMRCLFGVFGGFGASAVSLIAISAPKERAGEALGKLQTGNVVGGLIGPLMGGMLAESIGMEHSFIITGGAILFSTFLVMAFIKDTKKGPAEIKAYHPVSFRE